MTPREALLSVLEEADLLGPGNETQIDTWLDRIATAIDDQDAADHEECDSETWSWWIFRPEQVDPYWIRCTRLGEHETHEDSNTGAKWSEA